MLEVYKNIVSLCEKRGITLAALERNCGIAKGTIRDWKETYPSYDRVAKVARYFNVSTDDLTGWSNKEDEKNEDVVVESIQRFRNIKGKEANDKLDAAILSLLDLAK